VLLGENAISTIADLRRVYGAKGDEINLPMDFLYKDVSSLDAATFKARIDEAELGLDGLPPVFHFSNHDTSRQRTRFGDGVHDEAIAKITAAMTLTLRGTALMYYGEELGMADLPAEVLKDVPLGPKRKVADKRDPERSPMQWTDGPGAGFTTGVPWLPVNPDAGTINAARQQGTRARCSPGTPGCCNCGGPILPCAVAPMFRSRAATPRCWPMRGAVPRARAFSCCST
jgi:alpha-glucosidase